MVKCLPEFEYFIVFLKNRNFISKIRMSKVMDYTALRSADENNNCKQVKIWHSDYV